jgi:hypothetical protein
MEASSQVLLSPQRLAGERSQGGIQGEQDQLLQLRLSSQQAIEGVAVRQGLKTLLLKERPTGLQQHVCCWQAPEAVLGGDFPG